MRRLLCIIILVALTPALSSEVMAAGNLRQNSSRECAICHFRWMDQFVAGHGTALAPLEREDVAGAEMMCFSCHDGSTDDSREKVWLKDMHKTGMKPSDKVKIPKIFPLYGEGIMKCATCHSAHSVPTDTSIERTIFLRVSNKDSIMCEMCHVNQKTKDHNHPTHVGKEPLPRKIFDEGAVPGYKDRNHVICESCHTAHAGVDRNLVYTMKESALCIICHGDKFDDVKGPASMQKNHPLHVDFKPDPSLKIELKVGEKGTLQCLSCHKVHEHAPGSKALVAQKDAICTLCHADKDDGSGAPGSQKTNHPLLVSYKPDPASKITLDGGEGENKTVRCYTCHKIHDHSPGTKALAARRDPLCGTCHAAKYYVEKTDHDLNVTAPTDINAIEQKVTDFGVCVSCHVPHKATGPFLWARKLDKDPTSPSSLCLSCHDKNGVATKKTVGRMTHPVDITMEKTTFKEKDESVFPLYTRDDGTKVMECHTCHDPHRWNPTLMGKGEGQNVEGDGSTSFLRKQAGTDVTLCSTCHADKFLVAGTDHDLGVTAPDNLNIVKQTVKQGGVCSPCHVPHNATAPFLWARSFRTKPTSPSSLCLSCHDRKAVAEKKTVGENTHPVVVEVKQETTLPLFKNKSGKTVMECHSCHNPHQWQPTAEMKGSGANVEGDENSSFLRRANLRKPDLCGECHPRKALVAWTDHDMRVTAPDSVNLKDQKPKDGSVCSPCHAVHNASRQRVLWNAPLAELGQDFMEKACNGCHIDKGAGKGKVVHSGTHPQQFYFGYHKSYSTILLSLGQTPDTIPLYTKDGHRSVKGEITCPTCHDPHIWYSLDKETGEGENLEGTIVDSFLRKGARSELCYACHGIKTLLLYRYYHNAEEKKGLLGGTFAPKIEPPQSSPLEEPAPGEEQR